MSYAAGDPPFRASEPTVPTRSPSILAIAVCGFFAVVLWWGVAVQSHFIVPRFEKIFLDFKMRLPLATEWTVFVARGIWWVAPACLVASILVCFIPRSRWVGLILLVLLPLLLNLLIIPSLFFPCMELLDGLNGGNKK
jgi:type II secretory pathway component PulF